MSHTPKLMEEIMVQVPQEIAEIYRKATEDERQQMAMRIGVILKSSMRTRSEALAQIRRTMDAISAEAIAIAVLRLRSALGRSWVEHSRNPI